MLVEIKTLTDASTLEIGKQLDDIFGNTNDIRKHTTVLVDKSLRPLQFKSTNPPSLNTPNSSRRNSSTKTPHASYADAARTNAPIQPAKRMRSENSPIVNAAKPKFAGPKPKVSTKTAVTGLSIIAQPQRVEKPKFSKAVWVSRFNPSTTCDEISNYIMETAQIDDKAKFNVHKLVKKDQNLSLLKFVSFKIEVNDDIFELLKDESLWPENVWVREFQRDRNFGDFLNFPDLNAKKTRISTPNAMETNEFQLLEKTSPVKPKSPTQT